MKYTEENVLKQQTLDKKQGVDKNSKSGRSAQAKPKSSAGKICSFLFCYVVLNLDNVPRLVFFVFVLLLFLF